jgi:two-component system sensor histidine kinase MprB
VTLRSRLAAGTVATLTLALAAAFVFVYFAVAGELRGQIDSALRSRANTIAALHRRSPTGRLRPPTSRPTFGGAAGYVQFVTAAGKVELTPGETVRLPAAAGTAVASGRRHASFSDVTVDGTHLRVYTVHIGKNEALQVARPLTETDSVLRRVRFLLFGIALIAAVSGGIAGFLFLQRALRPVTRLTEDAERIAATGDLRARTTADTRDELGRLASAFNTMLDALGDSIAAQRQLVADASHELRTPLSSARTNLEVMQLHDELPSEERQRILAEAIDELREMTHLIEDLVDLARGDVEELALEPVRLDQLVADAVASAERRSGSTFDVTLTPTTVSGSAGSLARAVSNLLDNAVKWSPPGAVVEVRVAEGRVEVRDRGPGIDPVDLPHVFDRFYRARNARSMPGSGLGLAIVRQVAAAHDGSVTAANADGGGARFVLAVPTLA